MMNFNKKILGVIGGLGPGATTHFMELIIRMTDAATDQEHMDMIIYNYPSIPDRTGYILDNTNPSPLEPMIDIGNRLASQGADFLAIPCMTAHYFYDALQASVPVPIINCISETARCLKESGVERVGIMATDGTIRTGLFSQALESFGIRPITPSAQRQNDVMSLIYDNIKASLPVDMEKFYRIRQELFDSGAQAIILGCTELSLIKRDYDVGPNFINPMEVLAHQAVLRSGVKMKEQYRNLISK